MRALILTPTRELAAQVHDSFRTYGRYVPLRYAVVYGGVARTYDAAGDTVHAQKADSIAREVNRELGGRALF